MLERVWSKGNPPTLLVEMQIDTATMDQFLLWEIQTRLRGSYILEEHRIGHTEATRKILGTLLS